MSAFKDYAIWRQNFGTAKWIKTSHTVKARTDKEAQSKMTRMFAGAGFSSMSMIAISSELSPNEVTQNG